jgi:hypothetical protein
MEMIDIFAEGSESGLVHHRLGEIKHFEGGNVIYAQSEMLLPTQIFYLGSRQDRIKQQN